jgi:hypothetical protein
MRSAGNVAHVGEERKVYRILVRKPEGKRPLRRPRHRWEDGIRMDLREIGFWGGCGVDPVLAQDRGQWQILVNMVKWQALVNMVNLWVLAPQSESVTYVQSKKNSYKFTWLF